MDVGGVSVLETFFIRDGKRVTSEEVSWKFEDTRNKKENPKLTLEEYVNRHA